MDTDRLLRDIASLPEDAQQQVAAFVALLRSRSRTKRGGKPRSLVAFTDDPFIGMWRDREDMRNGGAVWVRRLREREWVRARPYSDPLTQMC